MKESRPKAVLGPPFASRTAGVKSPTAPPATRQCQHNQAAHTFPEPVEVNNILDRCFDELVRYYRHACAGRLLRGLMHRMNNPLQVLSFQLELLEQKSQEQHEILTEVCNLANGELQALHCYCLQKISQFRQELEKIQALARTIVLQGGHEEAEDRREIDLNELYRRELDLYLANPFFKYQVEKRIHFQEGIPPIYGHYLDFSQSFRNLLENALEAMEGSDRCCLTVSTAFENGQRLLHLGDTGPGISPKAIPLIFDPFFTTKSNQQNARAGLGLFMARRILAPYRGEIRIDSIPGETWVTVALPV